MGNTAFTTEWKAFLKRTVNLPEKKGQLTKTLKEFLLFSNYSEGERQGQKLKIVCHLDFYLKEFRCYGSFLMGEGTLIFDWGSFHYSLLSLGLVALHCPHVVIHPGGHANQRQVPVALRGGYRFSGLNMECGHWLHTCDLKDVHTIQESSVIK